MLQKIRIKGYKSIKEMELKLTPLNILIGANGVGKSNFISFFKLLNNIYEQRLQQFTLKSNADDLLHYGRKNTKQIYGYLQFDNNAYEFLLAPTDDGRLFIEHENSIYQNDRGFDNYNLLESKIKESTIYRNRWLREHLESYKIYHFHDTSNTAPLRSVANIQDNRLLKEDGGNLAAYLYYLQKKYPLNFKRIERIVRSIVPFFERFDLSPYLLDENRIFLEWEEKEYPETYFNANHLSDGSLRFIALVTLLMQPNLPKVIIIDEPELGLHPTAINKLAGLMKSAADKGCQIIVSTQSVTLLNNFETNDIVTVDKEENQSVFRRLDEVQLRHWIDDYSIGELWIKNIIKG
ncbi:MAG TPA: AAA family ATPase [Bacteroidales bacterium]|nr:AAA family ATPase [Bacteroidales bacterium]